MRSPNYGTHGQFYPKSLMFRYNSDDNACKSRAAMRFDSDHSEVYKLVLLLYSMPVILIKVVVVGARLVCMVE